MYGKEIFLSYRITDGDNFLFEPSLDENKLIRCIEPEKKIKGVYPGIIYPDGRVTSDGTVFPDFDKIDKMQVN
ncbi:hypothetical protein [Erwinia sp. E602]|uniref:hypothetical protein n=1 Tax=Erwinia sp. E602 TaxID=2675378 RepID=UPI002011D601|nr:hypothetical protein [Erwinia sp. E602]